MDPFACCYSVSSTSCKDGRRLRCGFGPAGFVCRSILSSLSFVVFDRPSPTLFTAACILLLPFEKLLYCTVCVVVFMQLFAFMLQTKQ